MKRLVLLTAALLGGCVSVTDASVTAPTPVAADAGAPAGYQYLYGSAEGGAEALTAMHALIAYVTDKAAHRPTDSVVLAAGSPLVHATFVPCGTKPLAVVFDMDETLVNNLGFEARAARGERFDPGRWSRWEQSGATAVAAVPGAGHVMEELRKLGVAPIVNTNRSAANAAGSVATLKAAGLGDFVHGRDLFLKGDEGEGSGKDARRATIAARYCVIAMAGDQLVDFSDAFNAPMPLAARRQLAVHSSAAGLWGKGWFVLPNPVYGSALKGSADEIFAGDESWRDPAEEK